MEALKDEVKQITLVDSKEIENTTPIEKIVPISMHPDYPDRHVMIGTELTEELRNALVEFLKKKLQCLCVVTRQHSRNISPGCHSQVVH